MTIYLDIIFLENVCMNSIILFTTGLVTKTKNKAIPILISSSIGALYVIGKQFTTNKAYSSLMIQIFLAITMIYIAFKPINLKMQVKYLIIFYLTSFVFGGCAFALLYYVRPQEILYNNGIMIGTYPIKIAFLGAMIGLVVLNIAFKLIKNRLSKNEMFCNIEIEYKNKSINLTALLDSGNMLREPISGTSVIVIEKQKMEKILEKDIIENLQNIIQGNYTFSNDEYISRFRLIPFSSLGKQNGMLLGFKPDNIIIEFDGIIHDGNNCIIGIYENEISKSRRYQGIIGLDALEERRELV